MDYEAVATATADEAADVASGGILGQGKTTSFLQGGSGSDGAMAGGISAAAPWLHPSWNVLFFLAACVASTTGFVAVVYWSSRFATAPFTLLREVFLLCWGLQLLALDFPSPRTNLIIFIRSQVYRHVLFLTRFTGRGLCYIFLSTLVFSSLYRNSLSVLLGALGFFFLNSLGIIVLIRGVILSTRLESLRLAVRASGSRTQAFLAGATSADGSAAEENQPISKDTFKALVEDCTQQHDLFTDEEVDFIMSAMAFTPDHCGFLTLDEFQSWILDRSTLLIV